MQGSAPPTPCPDEETTAGEWTAAIETKAHALDAARAEPGDHRGILALEELMVTIVDASEDVEDHVPEAWFETASRATDEILDLCAELGERPDESRPDLAEIAGRVVSRLEEASWNPGGRDVIIAASTRVLGLLDRWLREGPGNDLDALATAVGEQVEQLARYRRFDEALKHSQRLLVHIGHDHPLAASAYGEHARLLDQAGLPHAAVAFGERAIAAAEDDPADEGLLREQAARLEKAGDLAGAVAISERLLDLDLEPFPLAQALAHHRDLLAKQGDTEAAITAAERAVTAWEAVEKRPGPKTLVIGLRRLAHLLRSAGRPAEAVDAVLRASAVADGPLVDERTRAETLRYTVWHLLETSRYTEALPYSDRELAAWTRLTAGVRDHVHRAKALNHRAVALSHLRRYEESLECSAHAVAVYDLLSAQDPRHRSALGNALFNRQAAFARLRDHAAALECTARMIVTYDELASEDHALERAEAHMLHAEHLSHLDSRRRAPRKARQAMELYDELVEHHPGEHTAVHADALTSLLTVLDRTGEPTPERLAVSERILALEEELAAGRPRERVSKRALAWANHSLVLSDAGRLREAVEFSTRAVALCEEYPEDLHDEQRLAACLDTRALRLKGVGRYAEALEASTRALALYESLDPRLYALHTARALGNHGLCLEGVGRRDEAIEYFGRTVAVYEELGAEHRDGLAAALSNLAVHLRRADRSDEAMGPSQRSLEIREALARTGGSSADLGVSLLNHAHLLHADAAAALPYSQRAVTVLDAAVVLDRAQHLPMLAMAVMNQTSYLSRLDRDEEAASVSRRAVELYGELAEGERELYLPELATSLEWAVKYHKWAGLTEQAESFARQHSEALELLAARNESDEEDAK